MRRTLLALVVISMMAVACGDDSSARPDGEAGSTTTAPADATPSTVTPTTSAPTTGTAGQTSSTTTTVSDDRPVAPDFSLDLGAGGTFVLSEETRPVYLVFWAEW